MSAVSGLSDLRAAIVIALKTKLTGVNVDTHGGTFDLAEIKRYAALAPAVRVTIAGCGKGSRAGDGRWRIPVNFAAVVVTGDSVNADRTGLVNRDEAATALATAVMLIIQGNRFGFEGVSQPDNLTSRNEYSGLVDSVGIALWQVNWTSNALLGETVDEALAALSLLYVNGSVIGDGDAI